jgi:LysM repeat protein
MRTWIRSARVVLAWSILPVTLVAAGVQGSVHPAQASTRASSNTERHIDFVLTSAVSAAAVTVTAMSPPARYAVQAGDTLSGIAARFAVPGGWPALYTANRPLIGPNPDLLHAGTVVVLPGVTAPARYTVAAGDTLAGIAAGLAVHGGWPALYRANRQLIGPNPDAIRPGIVLAISRPAASSAPVPSTPVPPAPVPPRQQPQAAPSPSAPARTGHHPGPVTHAAPATSLPLWLILLLALGLLVLAVFLAEPVLVIRRRRQQAALARAVQNRKAGTARETAPGAGPQPPRADRAHILLADHERVIVTRNKHDDTICVLRPPGEDPMAILRVARLVLPEGPYGELAEQLRVPASWPMK